MMKFTTNLRLELFINHTLKNEKFDAWKIYSIVTDHFRPNPSRLRDWISQPKIYRI